MEFAGFTWKKIIYQTFFFFKMAHDKVFGKCCNSYLKRINKVDSVSCLSCRAINETVWHFLLICPGYTYEQWALEARLREKHKHLIYNNILDNVGFFVPLANYINASHRFSPMNH